MSNDHDPQHDVTQGENPGAQGDIGAGQGNPGDEHAGDGQIGEETPAIVGVGQPRRDELDDDSNEETRDDRAHAADERTDAGAPPAQEESA